MKSLPALVLAFICISPASAKDGEIEFWEDNKISPEQPFPAKVRAVLSSWVGYALLLEEIDGTRLCIAQFFHDHRSYVPIEGEDIGKFSRREFEGWTYLSPAVEAGRFSWAMGVGKIGAIFGKEDIARKSTFSEKAIRSPMVDRTMPDKAKGDPE